MVVTQFGAARASGGIMKSWTREDVRRALELYAVTDSSWLEGRALEEVVAEALSVPGITCVQLREKNATAEEREALARALQVVCSKAGVPLIINDDVDLALRVGADGVHLGQGDGSCAEARARLGEGAIIGKTAKTLEQALQAQAEGASYLGVGAVFPTSTKHDTWTIDHEVLREICARVSIPVVAIGGITAENASELADTGVAGIAVVSGIFAQDNIPQAVEELSRKARAVSAANKACLIGAAKDSKHSSPMMQGAQSELQSSPAIKSVVTIAGSDSSGGAGIQADLKTMTALGVFGQSAITALTAQNTMGVLGVAETSPEFLALQIKAIYEDIRPDAVKIGMVANEQLIKVIAEQLRTYNAQNIVLDPVMIATSGASLASDAVAQALVEQLFPLAAVVTPNLSEASVFAGKEITNPQEMVEAAHTMRTLGAKAVLVKGGHLDCSLGHVNHETDRAGGHAHAAEIFSPDQAYDFLLAGDGTEFWLREPRINTQNTHGTGCTLSSAIACYLAQGCTLPDAVKRAKFYLTQALANDLNLGTASGPINHIWHLDTEVNMNP